MSITIYDREIRDVCIIDDDVNSGYAMELTIENTNLNPIAQNEKILDIDNYISHINQSFDAIVTDHHLRKKNYSPVNGAEIVYRCYDYTSPPFWLLEMLNL